MRTARGPAAVGAAIKVTRLADVVLSAASRRRYIIRSRPSERCTPSQSQPLTPAPSDRVDHSRSIQLDPETAKLRLRAAPPEGSVRRPRVGSDVRE